MYLWKTDLLASDLKSNSVTEFEKMKYYLSMSIIVIPGVYLNSLFTPTSYSIFFTELLLVLIITIFGIRITFFTNKGNEGSDYLARLVCLSLPILIKMLLIGCLYGVVVGVIVGLAKLDLPNNSWVYSLLSIFLQAFYFWRLNLHLKAINS